MIIIKNSSRRTTQTVKKKKKYFYYLKIIKKNKAVLYWNLSDCNLLQTNKLVLIIALKLNKTIIIKA